MHSPVRVPGRRSEETRRVADVAVLLETPPPVLGGRRLVVAECVLRRRHLAQNNRLRRRDIVHPARLPHAHKHLN
jgi:hypothetical protein